MTLCQYEVEHFIDDMASHFVSVNCPKDATHISCKPFVGTLTCADHKCRCAKPITDQASGEEHVRETELRLWLNGGRLPSNVRVVVRAAIAARDSELAEVKKRLVRLVDGDGDETFSQLLDMAEEDVAAEHERAVSAENELRTLKNREGS